MRSQGPAWQQTSILRSDSDHLPEHSADLRLQCRVTTTFIPLQAVTGFRSPFRGPHVLLQSQLLSHRAGAEDASLLVIVKVCVREFCKHAQPASQCLPWTGHLKKHYMQVQQGGLSSTGALATLLRAVTVPERQLHWLPLVLADQGKYADAGSYLQP